MNNLENKAKFMALYWRQKIMVNSDSPFLAKNKPVNVCELDYISNETYLNVKSLSNITDEDITFIKSRKIDEQRINYQSDYASMVLNQQNADYLRSKSYAIQWNGVTVEQQIEYNWIKLI